MHTGKEKNKPTIGLALSGGSALGIAHIGVLQSLDDHKINIDYISGTSAGAIIAACYAFGVPMKKVAEIARKIKWSSISKFSISKMGLMNNSMVGEMVAELIGKGPDVLIEEAQIPLAIVATDISSGDKIIFTKGSLVKAIMASTCLPGLFVPVEVDGVKMVDGGLVENLPVSALKDFGADIKLGVVLRHYHSHNVPENILDIFSNAINILTKQQSPLLDCDSCLLIKPHLESYNSSDFGKTDGLIAEGYRATTLAIPEIKILLENKKALSFWQSFLRQIGLSRAKK